jgi:hypothetical protein
MAGQMHVSSDYGIFTANFRHVHKFSLLIANSVDDRND